MEKYKERIDKIIASTGLMSRKEVKKAASQKRIALNGIIVTDCSAKATETDTLTLDKKTVTYTKYIYIMLNKPKGYVCSTDDPHSPIVNLLLSEQLQKAKLFSIGRLDKDTTGLVILTNDGTLTHNLLSPSKHVDKKYHYNCKSKLSDTDIEKLTDGITLEDGTHCKPAKLEPTGETDGYITISEGKYHQIKRMFAAVGNGITDLERVSIGGVKLDNTLKYAEYRHLTEAELAELIT